VISYLRPACRYTSDTGQGDEFNAAAREAALAADPDAILTIGTLSLAEAPHEVLVDGYEAGVRPCLDAGIPVVAFRDDARSAHSCGAGGGRGGRGPCPPRRHGLFGQCSPIVRSGGPRGLLVFGETAGHSERTAPSWTPRKALTGSTGDQTRTRHGCHAGWIPSGGVMSDPSERPEDLDTRVLQRTVAHLADRYAGIFPPELVERVVFESYTTLARTAKVRTYLAPVAGHFAADRLAALAHAKDRDASGIPQVLFVGRHDTGLAQIAAALLAHHATGTAVVRSAGILPGPAVDTVVLEALAARGVEVGQVYPKPLTDDVVRAADWVITFGPRDAVPVYEHTVHQHWDVADLQDAAPERVGVCGPAGLSRPPAALRLLLRALFTVRPDLHCAAGGPADEGAVDA
jgi:protein-tyrosine-phosphatase